MDMEECQVLLYIFIFLSQETSIYFCYDHNNEEGEEEEEEEGGEEERKRGRK